MDLEQNFISICKQIRQAEARHYPDGCNERQSVRLLAVSKKKPASMIRRIWQAGQRDFGENHVQEAVIKIRELENLKDIRWHMIGPLQSNKTRQVATFFQWVHTIDRLKIANRLNDQRPLHMAPLNVCIQVNVSNETSKSGVLPGEVFPLAGSLIALPNLRFRGVMAIPQMTDFSCRSSVEQLLVSFRTMRTLFDSLRQQYPDHNIDTLSMGMSQDMELAIEEGSTCVRVGTALFGKRDQVISPNV